MPTLGRPTKRDLRAVANELPGARAVDDRLERIERDGEIGIDIGAGNLVIGKVGRGIEIGQQRDDGIARGFQAAGQIPAQIAQRKLQALGGAGGDDVQAPLRPAPDRAAR